MGYIKEPKGVNMSFQSPPLTDEARAEIAEFIRKDKLKHKKHK